MVCLSAQNTLKRKAKNVLKWPKQSPDLNPKEHLRRDEKKATQILTIQSVGARVDLPGGIGQAAQIYLCKSWRGPKQLLLGTSTKFQSEYLISFHKKNDKWKCSKFKILPGTFVHLRPLCQFSNENGEQLQQFLKPSRVPLLSKPPGLHQSG